MNKPFDATLKHLIDAFAADWIGAFAPQIGLPSTARADPLDAELSTVQPSVDKVFRLRPPETGLLHFEAQSSWDGTFPDRLLVYNTRLEHRYGGPVYTIALLLRRDAEARNLTGTLIRTYPDGSEYLRFNYKLIRLWELSADLLFEAGLGALPLALLTDDAKPRLQELVTRFAERVEHDAPDRETSNLLLTCGFILLGLRYDQDDIRKLFSGVQRMTESSTYRWILESGRAEGQGQGIGQGIGLGIVQGEQTALITMLEERFGTISQQIVERIKAVNDPSRLQAAIRQAIRIATPNDLQL